jgi:MFS family permease
VDKRRLLLLIEGLRSCAIALFAVAVATGRADILELYGAVFIIGVGETLFTTATAAYLPELVHTEGLLAANAWLSRGQLLGTQLLGLLVGGLLFTRAASAPFILDAGTFLVSGLALLSMPTVRGLPSETKVAGAIEPSDRTLWRREIASGWRLIRGAPVLTAAPRP